MPVDVVVGEVKAGARAARLPHDWQPSGALKAWASKKRPDLDLGEVIEKFKDHWAAAAGAKGVKRDWDATFRNWVRNEKMAPGSAPPAVKAVPRTCAYCTSQANQSTGSIWHCRAHTDDAMDGKPTLQQQKVAA